jgi:hypothetical protein
MVDMRDVAFRSPDLRARVLALRDEIVLAASGFEAKAPVWHGNFLEEGWCSPGFAGGASNLHNMDRLGFCWFRLETVSTGAGCGGVVYGAGCNPSTDGWGARISASRGGGSVMGDGLEVSFVRFVDRRPEERSKCVLSIVGAVDLGSRDVRVPFPGSDAEFLSAVTGSPEDLLEMGMAQYGAVSSALWKTFWVGTMRRPTIKYLHGGGVQHGEARPWPHQRVSMAMRARAAVRRERAFLEEHHEAWHETLTRIVPVAGLTGALDAARA